MAPKTNGQYAQLLELVKENPDVSVNTEELRIISRIGQKAMIRLKKLAASDPESDPWLGSGDLTIPRVFFQWYTGRRRELEKKNKEVGMWPPGTK